VSDERQQDTVDEAVPVSAPTAGADVPSTDETTNEGEGEPGVGGAAAASES